MRQAIAHALDKKEMINSAFVSGEFAEPANSILTPTLCIMRKILKTISMIKRSERFISKSWRER